MGGLVIKKFQLRLGILKERNIFRETVSRTRRNSLRL